MRGQLGDGTNEHSSTPVSVSDLGDAVAVATGGGHTCAVRESGEVVCWGYNGDGQLGDGTFADRSSPTTVLWLSDAIAIDAWHATTCAVRETGQVLCWGHNGNGQLGNGSTTSTCSFGVCTEPVAVLGVSDAVSVDVGAQHACAARQTGEVTCWGSNGLGELGDGTTMSYCNYLRGVCDAPVTVLGLFDATSISAGGALPGNSYACAVAQTGGAVCWGDNENGQLGDGTTASSATPVPVVGF
jgi:alpha-tubulin suppressor-like RCC1 family protein